MKDDLVAKANAHLKKKHQRQRVVLQKWSGKQKPYSVDQLRKAGRNPLALIAELERKQ